RHRALPRQRPPHRHLARDRRGLGVVLRRRSGALMVATIRDGFERREDMFPKLTPAQMARIERLSTRRRIVAAEILFEPGQRRIHMHVVGSAALEIVRPGQAGEQAVTVHGPGEFTGEVDMLTGRQSLVLARAREATELLELEREKLRSLVQTDAELSEIFMRA